MGRNNRASNFEETPQMDATGTDFPRLYLELEAILFKKIEATGDSISLYYILNNLQRDYVTKNYNLIIHLIVINPQRLILL